MGSQLGRGRSKNTSQAEDRGHCPGVPPLREWQEVGLWAPPRQLPETLPVALTKQATLIGCGQPRGWQLRPRTANRCIDM